MNQDTGGVGSHDEMGRQLGVRIHDVSRLRCSSLEQRSLRTLNEVLLAQVGTEDLDRAVRMLAAMKQRFIEVLDQRQPFGALPVHP